MFKKVFIEYKVSGDLTDAYSVSLSSSDNTFGIKKLASNTVIVTDDTSVDHPSTGVYEYEFEAEEGIIYIVSWKVQSTLSSSPRYVVEEVGPFAVDNIIRAVADYRGSLIQGTVNNLFLKITNIDGIPIDASTISISITDSNNIEVESGTPEKVSAGYYVFDWDVSSSQAIGEYAVTWSYNDGINNRTEIQYITISSDSNVGSSRYSVRINSIRMALESHMIWAQNIPVYNEQAKPSADLRNFAFSFPRWNQSAGIKIYRNNKLVESGVEVNYFTGKLTFDNTLTKYDRVSCTYNFRWFSDEELDRFLSNALHILNLYPGVTFYSMISVPDRFLPLVLWGALVDALRSMMMALQFQEPSQVFGPNAADKVFGNLDSLKKNYEETWKTGLEQKKLGPYAGLTRMIITNEFVLPGGRARFFSQLFK